MIIFICFAYLLLQLVVAQQANDSASDICPVILPPGNLETLSRFQRIINGTDPTGNLQTVMVLFLTADDEPLCSGTLISEFWVLTAAHWSVTPGLNYVRIGGKNHEDGVRAEIELAIPHPQYSIDSYTFDIQLVRLKEAAPPSSNFVQLNTNRKIPLDFAFVRTAGYGFDNEEGFTEQKLEQVDVPVQPNRLCGPEFPAEHIICAGYIRGGCDSCYRDGGGPLYLFDEDENIVQVGIVLFGNGCARPRRPGGYGRVSRYISWIKAVAGQVQESESGQNVFASFEESLDESEFLSPTAEASEIPAASSDISDEAISNVESDSEDVAPGTDVEELDTSPEETIESTAESEPLTEENVCFPASAMVLLEDGTVKTMEHLHVGDRVQIGPFQFSEVIMFTHRLYSGTHDFVNLHPAGELRPLALSRGHILPVNGEMKAAEMGRVGDTILLGNGSATTIARITTSQLRGLFNPQTKDGRIVVNGIVASTYTTAVPMRMAHAFLAPVRYAIHIWETVSL